MKILIVVAHPNPESFNHAIASTAADAARAAGPFDAREPYLVDLDYWLRLLDQGTAVHQATPLASFRISPRQWSAAIGSRQSRQFQAFVGRLARSRFPETSSALLAWSVMRARQNAVLRGILAWWLARSAGSI